MKKIPYETSTYMCITLCPHKEKQDQFTSRVGSTACIVQCEYMKEHNEIEQWVLCSYDTKVETFEF